MIDWNNYPNFSKREFDCKQTGENAMHPEFMARLQQLRSEFNAPMIISSGYRSPRHSVEAKKAQPGAHALGRACDVAVSGLAALRLVELAIAHGFTGIGINQKGSGRFIHLDDISGNQRFPRPTIWSY